MCRDGSGLVTKLEERERLSLTSLQSITTMEGVDKLRRPTGRRRTSFKTTGWRMRLSHHKGKKGRKNTHRQTYRKNQERIPTQLGVSSSPSPSFSNVRTSTLNVWNLYLTTSSRRTRNVLSSVLKEVMSRIIVESSRPVVHGRPHHYTTTIQVVYTVCLGIRKRKSSSEPQYLSSSVEWEGSSYCSRSRGVLSQEQGHPWLPRDLSSNYRSRQDSGRYSLQIGRWIVTDVTSMSTRNLKITLILYFQMRLSSSSVLTTTRRRGWDCLMKSRSFSFILPLPTFKMTVRPTVQTLPT